VMGSVDAAYVALWAALGLAVDGGDDRLSPTLFWGLMVAIVGSCRVRVVVEPPPSRPHGGTRATARKPCLQTVQPGACGAHDLGWKVAAADWKGRLWPDRMAHLWPRLLARPYGPSVAQTRTQFVRRSPRSWMHIRLVRDGDGR
jgi:hypothetical protein